MHEFKSMRRKYLQKTLNSNTKYVIAFILAIQIPLTKQNFERKIGMIPMFPVPKEGMRTSSIMGGWLMGIPQTSKHKELAWELITIMLKPEILSPVLAKYGYLPTQVSIGEGPYSAVLRNSIP
jgi:multiple sugar transport system substrate-binding protein